MSWNGRSSLSKDVPASVDTTALVDGWLTECRPKLPIQNPLWAFIHNNILLNLEDRPFHEAVRGAAALYRARPYENEAFYRAELERGRIRRECLDGVLAAALPGSGPDRVERFLSEPSLGNHVPPVALLRLAPRLEAEHHAAYDRQLQDFLVPLVASFLDQGMAAWTNPFRAGTLWGYFVASVHATPKWGTDWAGALKRRLEEHERAGRPLEEIIAAEVREAAPVEQAAAYCLETLFALKGWSGMITRLEAEPALAPVEAPRASLKEWLAVMLVSTHALDAWILEKHGRTRAVLRARPAFAPESANLGRLHLWQEAYERSFAGELLLHVERGMRPASQEPARVIPRFQALLCMDDREESFRRALETEECGVETWGSVGFFGVDMRFEAVGAARPTRQCPPVVEPSRTIKEVPLDGEAERLERARRAGRAEARVRLFGLYHSRTLLRGVLVSLALASISSPCSPCSGPHWCPSSSGGRAVRAADLRASHAGARLGALHGAARRRQRARRRVPRGARADGGGRDPTAVRHARLRVAGGAARRPALRHVPAARRPHLPRHRALLAAPVPPGGGLPALLVPRDAARLRAHGGVARGQRRRALPRLGAGGRGVGDAHLLLPAQPAEHPEQSPRAHLLPPVRPGHPRRGDVDPPRLPQLGVLALRGGHGGAHGRVGGVRAVLRHAGQVRPTAHVALAAPRHGGPLDVERHLLRRALHSPRAAAAAAHQLAVDAAHAGARRHGRNRARDGTLRDPRGAYAPRCEDLAGLRDDGAARLDVRGDRRRAGSPRTTGSRTSPRISTGSSS